MKFVITTLEGILLPTCPHCHRHVDLFLLIKKQGGECPKCGKAVNVLTLRNYIVWTLCLLFAWFWSIPVLQLGLRRTLFIVFVGWFLAFLIARKLTLGISMASDSKADIIDVDQQSTTATVTSTAYGFALYFLTFSCAIVAVAAALQGSYVVAGSFIAASLVALPAMPLKSKILRICLIVALIVMGNYVANKGA